MELLDSYEIVVTIKTNKGAYERVFDKPYAANLCLREIVNAKSLEEQIDMLSADYDES